MPGADGLQDTLVHEGMSAGAAAEAGRRLLKAAAVGRSALAGSSGRDAGAGFFVPGRIEILGKHTDYAGGRSLVAAVEAGISSVVFADSDPRVLVIDTDTGDHASFPIEGAEDEPAGQGDSSPSIPPDGGREGWRHYPETYLRRIRRDLPALGGQMEGGAVVALSSSLPRAAGMSSSSALLVTLHLALASRYRWAEAPEYRTRLADREFLAGYIAAIESGVGTHGGSQDHVAILNSRPGHAVQCAFAPTRLEGEVPIPAGWTFALAASGVAAPKAEGRRADYNGLVAQTEAIMDLWRGARDDAPEPHLGAIAEGRPSDLVRLGTILQEARHLRFTPLELTRRAIQFTDECSVHVPGAVAALLQGDLKSFGGYVAASHEAGRAALANDTPETEALTATARELGAAAASPFGAGFGGSVWALVREQESAEFLDRWRSAYLASFPGHESDARFFRSRAGPPALRVF